MHRLFVAIRPPADIRARLLAAMGGIAGARWQDDSQLHLTLRFIGEVDRHRALDVHAALGAIHHPGFEIALEGIHGFDRKSEPRALWAGVAPHAPLKTLHDKIGQALARIGLEPERRAFLPHITLARLPRGAGAIGPFLAGAGGLSGPPFAVDAFALFESRLTAEGARYDRIESYGFDRPFSPRQSSQE
jgi:2'-5' RNA ligase